MVTSMPTMITMTIIATMTNHPPQDLLRKSSLLAALSLPLPPPPWRRPITCIGLRCVRYSGGSSVKNISNNCNICLAINEHLLICGVISWGVFEAFFFAWQWLQYHDCIPQEGTQQFWLLRLSSMLDCSVTLTGGKNPRQAKFEVGVHICP